jgi:hypothetical protein
MRRKRRQRTEHPPQQHNFGISVRELSRGREDLRAKSHKGSSEGYVEMPCC